MESMMLYNVYAVIEEKPKEENVLLGKQKEKESQKIKKALSLCG